MLNDKLWEFNFFLPLFCNNKKEFVIFFTHHFFIFSEAKSMRKQKDTLQYSGNAFETRFLSNAKIKTGTKNMYWVCRIKKQKTIGSSRAYYY